MKVSALSCFSDYYYVDYFRNESSSLLSLIKDAFLDLGNCGRVFCKKVLNTYVKAST